MPPTLSLSVTNSPQVRPTDQGMIATEKIVCDPQFSSRGEGMTHRATQGGTMVIQEAEGGGKGGQELYGGFRGKKQPRQRKQV